MRYLPKFTYSLLIFSIYFNSLSGQKYSRAQYIEKIKDMAIKEMNEYKIPASITIAQACLESADGNSRLAVEGNNHFGIKCANWVGDTIRHHDDKRDECFRKYPTMEQSFTDHSLFIVSRERYNHLLKIPITDYKSWAEGLRSSGYATNPKYAQQLIKIIEDYSLYRFDTNSYDTSEKDEKFVENITPTKDNPIIGNNDTVSIERVELKINKVSCIVSGINDSYNSLAEEYDLFPREILRFNDLKKESVLEPGTIVYIERKRKKYTGDESKYKIVNEKTYYEVSQKFGIQLKYLLKMNSLKDNDVPTEGKEIKLK